LSAQYEMIWRPVYEGRAAIGWTGALALTLGALSFSGLPFKIMIVAVLVAGGIAVYRWVQAVQLWRRHAWLSGRPMAFAQPKNVAKFARKQPDRVWLGVGFEWTEREVQLAYDLRKRNPRDIKLPMPIKKANDWFGHKTGIDERGAEWVMFPQVAGLVIGDRVEIGACTTIQRGALQNTVIEEGCRISDHVRIGHGVRIGRDSVVTCCTEISGSVQIGEHVWIGPQTSIRESLTIGDRAVIGIGSNLVKDVPVGTTVVGNPARPFRQEDR